VDRDQAGGERGLGVGADPADVPGVAQRDDAGAVRLGPLDAERHGLCSDRLAEALVAVEHHERAAVGDDIGPLPGPDPALPHPVDVQRHAHDSVAVVAREVRPDQLPGDEPRLLLGAPGGGEDRAHGRFQLGGGDEVHLIDRHAPSMTHAAAQQASALNECDG
jgi:hypothetical protein